MMEADDGLSGAGVYDDVLPGLTAEEREWLWADGCGADAGRLLVDLGRLRLATRALVEKLEKIQTSQGYAMAAEMCGAPPYAPELAAVRDALGGE